MKAVHKIWRPAVAVLAVVGIVGTVAFAARQTPSTLKKVSPNADGAVASTAAATAGINFTTGFEAVEGYVPRDPGFVAPATHVAPVEPPFSGYIRKQPGCPGGGPLCWDVTGAGSKSLWEGHVDQVHAATGTQHLRLSYDGTTRTNMTGFGLGVDARIPGAADVTAKPIVPNTVSADIAISNTFGMDFRFQPQSNTQGFLATSALFLYTGGLYILDDVCGSQPLSFFGAGYWDATGGYQNYTVAMDPCNNTINYYYGGALVYTGCVYAGSDLEQFLLFGDNYPGSDADVDNLVMETASLPGDVCPSVCGDGQLDGTETCDVGIPCEPGHTCDPVTCQCSRICTLGEPCNLTNGVNGPFAGPFDAAYGGIFLYTAGTEAVSVETCGSTGFDTNILYFGSWNLPDPGTANDDCCDELNANCGSYGVGADPTASCYIPDDPAPYPSCACYDLPEPGDNVFLVQTNVPGAGDQLFITVNKKATCGGGHVGSCCHTNTHDGNPVGCVENVAPADCTGAFNVWSGTLKCDSCVCIPDCAGRECGGDGCGGICAPDNCDDGNVCTDDSCGTDGLCAHTNNTVACDDGLFCTVQDTCGGGTCQGVPNLCSDSIDCTHDACIEATDSCTHTADASLCDNGLFCDGVEICDLTMGCLDGADPCDATQTCYEYKDHCFDNIIPTVSEWGLVILTLLLLTGAKVYFSRRQATA